MALDISLLSDLHLGHQWSPCQSDYDSPRLQSLKKKCRPTDIVAANLVVQDLGFEANWPHK
jgi:hypothetical protein